MNKEQHRKLMADMMEKGVTSKDLANALGITLGTFYHKMDGAHDFKASEISIISGRLALTPERIRDIFIDKWDDKDGKK